MATSIYAKPIKAGTILKFTLPTILMMVFMSLYTVVDGIVVANCVGSDALSAINIVYPFTLVFMAVGLMFSTGSNAIIAKKMGEGKQEEANRLMSGVAITATVISAVIAVLFTIFAEPMYMMFGSNEKILPYCIDYGSVMIPYGFVMCWQMLNQSYLVTADKPHIMLIFSILSGCTNIVLDILFMAVWGIGIIGAGLGTIIGMAVGAGMYWLGLFEAAVLVAIQIILHRFPVGADALTTQELLVELEDTDELRARFDDLLKEHRGQVTESSLTRQDGCLRMEITVRLEPPITHDEALAFMRENPGVKRMSV